MTQTAQRHKAQAHRSFNAGFLFVIFSFLLQMMLRHHRKNHSRLYWLRLLLSSKRIFENKKINDKRSIIRFAIAEPRCHVSRHPAFCHRPNQIGVAFYIKTSFHQKYVKPLRKNLFTSLLFPPHNRY